MPDPEARRPRPTLPASPRNGEEAEQRAGRVARGPTGRGRHHGLDRCARATPWPRSRGTAPPPSRATRSSTTCSPPTPRVKAALVKRLGETVLGEDGRPDRARIAQAVFEDAEKLAFLEGLLHPLVSREYNGGRPWRACRILLGVRDGSAAALRGRRRLSLRPGRALTAPKKLREARGRVPTDDRERPTAARPREEAKRADFVYSTGHVRGSLDDWVAGVIDRSRRRTERESPAAAVLVIAGVLVGAGWVVLVGSAVVLAARLPAAVQADRPWPRRAVPARSRAAGAGVIYAESEFDARARSQARRDRADAAFAFDGARHRRADGRDSVRRRRPLRPGAQRALRVLVSPAPARPLRQRAHRPRGLPRRARERRPLAGGRHGHRLPRDTRGTSSGCCGSSRSTRTRTRRARDRSSRRMGWPATGPRSFDGCFGGGLSDAYIGGGGHRR